jgi:hypothetical protein
LQERFAVVMLGLVPSICNRRSDRSSADPRHKAEDDVEYVDWFAFKPGSSKREGFRTYAVYGALK